MADKITKPITDKERDDKTNEIIVELSNKQNVLTAGANINIENNVISATNDALVVIDSTLSTTSENPVQNKVITGALNGKAEDNSVVHTTGNETITGIKTLDGWLKLKDSNNSSGETILRVNSNNKLSDLDGNIYAYVSEIPKKTSKLVNDSGFLTSHQDISGKQDKSNLVTSLSASSTDIQYPSAKCVYDLVGDIETALNTINSGVSS